MTNSPALPDPRRLAVSAEGVVKTYERGSTAARVLDGVDLHVERGRSVFLAGPSGSGKTTLLSILGCILSADEGRVNILGQDLSALSPRQRSDFRRDRIGFVFQRFHLIRGLTACENIGVPLVLRGMPPHAVRQRALTLLEMVGLADKANAHSHSLSAGQCQRVALARALANDPELILADEPTASLDAAKGHDMMELLWRLTDSGRENGGRGHPRSADILLRRYRLLAGKRTRCREARADCRRPTSPDRGRSRRDAVLPRRLHFDSLKQQDSIA